MRGPTRSIKSFEKPELRALRAQITEAHRDSYPVEFVIDSVPAGTNWGVGNSYLTFGIGIVPEDMVLARGYVVAEGASGTFHPHITLFRASRDFAQLSNELEIVGPELAYEFSFIKTVLYRGDVLTTRARTDTNGQLTNAKVHLMGRLSA